jgi:hypothetical protein
MKASDTRLDRLIGEAKKAPGRAPDVLSLALEGRIIAALRNSRSTESGRELLSFFRLGLSFACVLMVVIITISVHEIGQDRAAQLTTPGAIINLALAQ